MEEALLQMAAQVLPVLTSVFAAIGLILVIALGMIRLTPTKKDDEVLDKVRSVPILGGLIAALMKRAPIKPVEPDQK